MKNQNEIDAISELYKLESDLAAQFKFIRMQVAKATEVAQAQKTKIGELEAELQKLGVSPAQPTKSATPSSSDKTARTDQITLDKANAALDRVQEVLQNAVSATKMRELRIKQLSDQLQNLNQKQEQESKPPLNYMQQKAQASKPENKVPHTPPKTPKIGPGGAP